MIVRVLAPVELPISGAETTALYLSALSTGCAGVPANYRYDVLQGSKERHPLKKCRWSLTAKLVSDGWKRYHLVQFQLEHNPFYCVGAYGRTKSNRPSVSCTFASRGTFDTSVADISSLFVANSRRN